MNGSLGLSFLIRKQGDACFSRSWQEFTEIVIISVQVFNSISHVLALSVLKKIVRQAEDGPKG